MLYLDAKVVNIFFFSSFVYSDKLLKFSLFSSTIGCSWVKLKIPYPLYPVEVFSFIVPWIPNLVFNSLFNHSANFRGNADFPVAIPASAITKGLL